jgi:hypothetical protein
MKKVDLCRFIGGSSLEKAIKIMTAAAYRTSYRGTVTVIAFKTVTAPNQTQRHSA